MNLRYLGDALDFWKGALLEHLVAEGSLESLVVDPMASDPARWEVQDVRLYARLLNVSPHQVLVGKLEQVSGLVALDEIPRHADVFLDPDTGIATGKVKHRFQYVRVEDVLRLLNGGESRVVAVYQHVSRTRTSDRVDQVVSRFLEYVSWVSYESGTVAMLFFSYDPRRIVAVKQSLCALLGHHSELRVRNSEDLEVAASRLDGRSAAR